RVVGKFSFTHSRVLASNSASACSLDMIYPRHFYLVKLLAWLKDPVPDPPHGETGNDMQNASKSRVNRQTQGRPISESDETERR
ncbi:MAG: hypothetical protein P8P17_16920, partial [Pseudomonadales bacterium]|nr:hypothetical protein [Pseudomonadales bacterium]